MNKSVTIPLSFLRDMVVLLDAYSFEELVGRYSRKRGRNPNADYALTLWELKMKLHRLDIIEIYVQTFDDITDDEMNQLYEWVARGHSVFNNPCFIYDDKGLPMDFINGCRVDDELCEDYSNHLLGEPSNWEEDDLPFCDDELPF